MTVPCWVRAGVGEGTGAGKKAKDPGEQQHDGEWEVVAWRDTR